MKVNRLILLALVACMIVASGARAAVVASDDYESYGSLSYGSSGGTGLGAITYREGTGGGVFLSTGGEKIDGTKSFGVFASSGGQAADRSITNASSLLEYTVSARFNLDNSVAFSGLNLKTAAGSTFGANELISFGIRPADGNNSIFVGGSVNKTINLGAEIRGAVIDFDLIYYTTLGIYDLGAKFRSSPTFTRVTGNLKQTGVAATTLGFGNFNTGTNQNLIIDSIQLQQVPEPASAAVLAIAGLAMIRRRRA